MAGNEVLVISATLLIGKEAWEGAGMFPCPNDGGGWESVQVMVCCELEAMIRTLVPPRRTYRLTVQGIVSTLTGPEFQVFQNKWHAFELEGGSVFGWIPIALGGDVAKEAANNG